MGPIECKKEEFWPGGKKVSRKRKEIQVGLVDRKKGGVPKAKGEGHCEKPAGPYRAGKRSDEDPGAAAKGTDQGSKKISQNGNCWRKAFVEFRIAAGGGHWGEEARASTEKGGQFSSLGVLPAKFGKRGRENTGETSTLEFEGKLIGEKVLCPGREG